MANNNLRKSTAAPPANRAVFYGVLIAIVVLGAGAILYLGRSSGKSTTQTGAYEQLRQNYATAGPPQPYVLGDSNARVEIEEFADFECPSCGRFAALTEPDIRKRLIATGMVRYKYYDFPLPMHKNTIAASNAAACANEQGKFWEMHDQLFAGQDQWGLAPGEGEVTDNPKPVFLGFARAIGLDAGRWEQCFDARKYQGRINANAGEALRRNVEQTPTFYVDGMKVLGAVTFDSLKKVVDSVAKMGRGLATDSAINNIIKH